MGGYGVPHTVPKSEGVPRLVVKMTERHFQVTWPEASPQPTTIQDLLAGRPL